MKIVAPGAEKRVLLDAWCNGPRLVYAKIQAKPANSALDANASPLHLEWEVENTRKRSDIFECFQPSRESGSERNVLKWRSAGGVFLCVTAAKLFAVGGAGEWRIEVDSNYAPIATLSRQKYGLQRIVDTRRDTDHLWIPPGHTHLSLIAGYLSIGGVVCESLRAIPIELAETVGWEALGIIETFVEV